jgi:hypothetical protein
MTPPSATSPEIALRALRDRWVATKAAERANAQSYIRELCEALGVPTPLPAGTGYEFELPVKLVTRDGTETQGFVDCYKARHFILEAKDVDGGASDVALRRAYGQARQYAAHDPSGMAPPYLLVLDVAKTLLVYHRWGGTFQGFAAGHRIDLATLDQRRADIDLLRDIWTAPAKRDPRQHAQAVTQEIAAKLARLAAGLESRGFAGERVARFLMRVVFSCFAEDVDLLPRDAFRQTVQRAGVEGDPVKFQKALEALWRAMDEGGMYGFESLLRFNGHFFTNAEALPLEKPDIVLLLEAAKADWKDVEPTIFGTLLTRALDPEERHRLGAEYTPRAFIERLVRPTVEEPVRERWTAVQAEVLQLRETGKPKDRAAAEQRLRDFLGWMQGLRVLDPACGSGNFLYVTMHVLKDLEYEVVRELEALTGHPELRMQEIGPANFLGIEVKPWAREIAELTLWIGFHQYWKRHHAVQPPEPVLMDTGTLELRDAVLAWDSVRHVPEKDRPDPTPRIAHPITGELVPDPAATLPYMEHVGARPAPWPEADFIVGNPPYLGQFRQRCIRIRSRCRRPRHVLVVSRSKGCRERGHVTRWPNHHVVDHADPESRSHRCGGHAQCADHVGGGRPCLVRRCGWRRSTSRDDRDCEGAERGTTGHRAEGRARRRGCAGIERDPSTTTQRGPHCPRGRGKSGRGAAARQRWALFARVHDRGCRVSSRGG